MYTIGQLCKKFQFSRGTLLYYDSIGLLKPSVRAANNYRRYSEDDLKRLQQICLYRETGMPLNEIKRILESPQNNLDLILEKQLGELNETIRRLQIQRQLIVQMVKNKRIPTANADMLDENAFVLVLNKIGLNGNNLEQLHMEFEKLFPEEHQAFLEFLRIPPDEIKKIREHSQKQCK